MKSLAKLFLAEKLWQLEAQWNEGPTSPSPAGPSYKRKGGRLFLAAVSSFFIFRSFSPNKYSVYWKLTS